LIGRPLFEISLQVTWIYLGLIVLLIARVEVLRLQKRLPAGVEAVFSPVRRGTDTWAAIWGNGGRRRMGRAFRLVFGRVHRLIADRWTTGLVYGCRVMLAISFGLQIASGLTASR